METPQSKVSLKSIKQVVIRFVPHSMQRYETCGDWALDEEGTLLITVSETEDPRCAFAVAHHEFDEAILCTHRGITTQEVDEFDMGEGINYDDPGRHPSAPYHREHLFATAAERRFVETLGIPWDVHNRMLNNLEKENTHGNETSNA